MLEVAVGGCASECLHSAVCCSCAPESSIVFRKSNQKLGNQNQRCVLADSFLFAGQPGCVLLIDVLLAVC